MTRPTPERLKEIRFYADQCLERAEKATSGPWDVERICWESGDVSYEINDDNQFVAFRESDFEHPLKAKFNAELYAHSRTDVPELARRLKEVCQRLKNISRKSMHAAMFDCDPLVHDDLSEIESECFDAIYELERPLGGNDS